MPDLHTTEAAAVRSAAPGSAGSTLGAWAAGAAAWAGAWVAMLGLDGPIDLAHQALLLVLGGALAALWWPAVAAGAACALGVADADLVPQALLHNLKHNQVLHARNLVLTVQFAPRPWVAQAERLTVEPLGRGFWRVKLLFGFMDEPDVPRALADPRWTLLAGDPMATSWFLSRETVVPGHGPGMALWQQRLFAAMARRASRATDYFRLPDNAVVELGTPVQL